MAVTSEKISSILWGCICLMQVWLRQGRFRERNCTAICILPFIALCGSVSTAFVVTPGVLRPSASLRSNGLEQGVAPFFSMSSDVGTDDEVRTLLSTARTIAVVGATNKASMPVHGVMRFLIQQGYKCIPVNPREAGNGGEILGVPAVARVSDIKEKVDMVDIFMRADRNASNPHCFSCLYVRVPAAVDDAIAQGAGAVWTQLNIDVDEETISKAKAAGMVVITNRCPAIEMRSLGIQAPKL